MTLATSDTLSPPPNVQMAITTQQQLRHHVVMTDDIGEVRIVAGVDVGFRQQGTVAHAAVAVLRYPDLCVLETALAQAPTPFPYVPGLLSFRELPVILKALRQLKNVPDLVLCDGQGVAHPRRFGIASHLGVSGDVPTIGVGKTRLCGHFEDIPSVRGQWVPLMAAKASDECIGAVLCTRNHVKPLFISIGHRISLATALHFVMTCTPRYRLPEPIRWAHRLASGLMTGDQLSS